jgi:hypothetical protein
MSKLLSRRAGQIWNLVNRKYQDAIDDFAKTAEVSLGVRNPWAPAIRVNIKSNEKYTNFEVKKGYTLINLGNKQNKSSWVLLDLEASKKQNNRFYFKCF